MKRVLFILIIVMSLLMSTSASAFAADNRSPWDASLQLNSAANDKTGNLAEAKTNSAAAHKQKEAFREKAREYLIKNAPKKDSAALSSSKTWTSFAYTCDSHGGSGVGYSDSTWFSGTSMGIGARAEIYGEYWALGQGTVFYRPPESGSYKLKTKYYLTGSIWPGSSLTTRVLVTDTTSGECEEYVIGTLTGGYYDGSLKTKNTTIYLTGGHNYTITFEAESDAGSVLAVTMSDFFSEEFDGTQRQVDWDSFKLTKL